MFVYKSEPFILLIAGIMALCFLGYPALTGLTLIAWVAFRCGRSMRRHRLERKEREAIIAMARLQQERNNVL
jgi:hypothetical protein